MEENKIEINEYMFFDKENGYFYLTSEAANILYRQKEVICSYSGANEWLHNFTCEMFNLYSGLSPYNYSLGSVDYKDMFNKIFAIDKNTVIQFVENSLSSEYGIRIYAMIKNIINDLPSSV